MHELLAHTDHRPWPVPQHLLWIMAQTWRNLLFAHWPLPPEILRPLVPRELPLDTFDGHAWLGITPFYLAHLHPRGVPPLPGLSNAPELNVRTYSTLDDKPGVFFFSLDIANLSAVWGARMFYRLPYWHATMRMKAVEHGFEYRSRRIHGPQPAEFRARYYPFRALRNATPGTLEYFLVERYCLYSYDRGRLYRAQIHHLPWPLQDAEAEIEHNTMTVPLGIGVPDAAPLLHFAHELKVLVWPPERLA